MQRSDRQRVHTQLPVLIPFAQHYPDTRNRKQSDRRTLFSTHRPGGYNSVVLVLFCASLVYFLMALAGTGGTGYEPREVAIEGTAGSNEAPPKIRRMAMAKKSSDQESGLPVEREVPAGSNEGLPKIGQTVMAGESFDQQSEELKGEAVAAENWKYFDEEEQADRGNAGVDESAEVGLRGEGDPFNIIAIAQDELETYGMPEPILFASSSPLLHAARQFTLRSHHGHFHHRILSAQVQLSDEEVGEAWWKHELAKGGV